MTQANVKVTIQLFGAFRKYGASIDLSVPSGSAGPAIKAALAGKLGGEAEALIYDSVLANDDTVLPAEFVIGGDTELAILPPVCGG